MKALAVLNDLNFKYVTGFFIDVSTWERPIIAVIPLDEEPFMVHCELSANHVKYALDKTEILLDLNGSLAKKLGYSESDYYVRLQALFSLIQLAHPLSRKVLCNFKSSLGKKVKKISFNVINIIENDISKFNINPRALIHNLVYVFNHLRDLNTADSFFSIPDLRKC